MSVIIVSCFTEGSLSVKIRLICGVFLEFIAKIKLIIARCNRIHTVIVMHIVVQNIENIAQFSPKCYFFEGISGGCVNLYVSFATWIRVERPA